MRSSAPWIIMTVVVFTFIFWIGPRYFDKSRVPPPASVLVTPTETGGMIPLATDAPPLSLKRCDEILRKADGATWMGGSSTAAEYSTLAIACYLSHTVKR